MTTATQTDQSQGIMDRLLADKSELIRMPRVGEIVVGAVIEKSRHAIYVDLGIWGLGVIYGRELKEDPDTFRNTNIGDHLHGTVVRFDNEEDCIELSLQSATRERSWTELRQKLDVGGILETEILDANRGGLIVRVHGVTGFLPVSQLAPDHYPRVEGGDPTKILGRLREYINQKFRVKVITADQENDKLIVSEKAAVGDELSSVLKELKAGKIVAGIVSGVVDFGIFVKFEEAGKELEGLVHISELAWQRIDNLLDFVRPGDRVQAKVIEVDGLRISLSIKQLKEDPWRNVQDKFKVGDTVEGEILKVTPFGAFIKLDQDIHGLVHISELPEGTQRDPNYVLKIGDRMKFTIISLEPADHRLGLSLRATVGHANISDSTASKSTSIDSSAALDSAADGSTQENILPAQTEQKLKRKPKKKKSISSTTSSTK